MFVDETEDNIFDKFLFEEEYEKACDWVMEASEKAPWDQHIKSLLAFSYLLGPDLDFKKAKIAAEEVLATSLYNEWALAACYFLQWPKTIEGDERFQGWNGFRLDPVWIAKFWALGQPVKAWSLSMDILKYGNEEQIELVKRDFGDIQDRVLELSKTDKWVEKDFELLSDEMALEIENNLMTDFGMTKEEIDSYPTSPEEQLEFALKVMNGSILDEIE